MNKEWVLNNIKRSLLDSIVYEKSVRRIKSYLYEIKRDNVNHSVYPELGKILFVYQVNRFLKAVSFYLVNSDTLQDGGINNLQEQWFLQKKYQDLEKEYMANWIKEKVIPFFYVVLEKLSIDTESRFIQFVEILEVTDMTIDQIEEGREMAETWIYDTIHILKTDIENYHPELCQ